MLQGDPCFECPHHRLPPQSRAAYARSSCSARSTVNHVSLRRPHHAHIVDGNATSYQSSEHHEQSRPPIRRRRNQGNGWGARPWAGPWRPTILTVLNCNRLWSYSGRLHDGFHGFTHFLESQSCHVVLLQEPFCPADINLPDDQPFFWMAPATLVVAMSGFSAMRNPHTPFRPSLQFMTKQRYSGVC